MRGRKPIPTELKILSGAFEKNPNRRNDNEPDAPERAPRCPIHLDNAAKKKWKETAAVLKEMGLFSIAYADLIELYADTYSRYRDAQDKVKKVGIAILGKDGEGHVTITRNPFETAMHKYRDALVKIEAELGLTPSSKSRLQVEKKAKSAVASRQRHA